MIDREVRVADLEGSNNCKISWGTIRNGGEE
jgi:hypothetical protein